MEPGARLVSANLVGVERRRRIVEETLHLKDIDGRLRRKLRLRSLLPPQERLTGSVCSLVDSRQWSGSLYHWFLDCLPRLIAVDHHSHRFGEPTRVIVPAILNPWQEASLHLLGIAPERRIRHCPVGRGGLRVERLIASVAHRQRPRPGGSTSRGRVCRLAEWPTRKRCWPCSNPTALWRCKANSSF